MEARRSLISERFKSVIFEALHAGLDGDEIKGIVAGQLEILDGNVATVSSLENSAKS